MSEFLKYRFPGKENITLIGNFYPLESLSEYKGFILSSFLKDERYCFIPKSEGNIEFYFSEEIPYCVNAREYYMQAHELLNGLNYFQMEKAVFSRIKKVEFNYINIEILYEDLCIKYPDCFVYLLSGKDIGTWIGATPEILAESYGKHLFTCAMAGTKKSNEDRNWTEKEIFEQKIVKNDILNILQIEKINEVEVSDTYDFIAGPVTHLRTDISLTIPSNYSAIEIADMLHPTSAVCGSPFVQAVELIQTVEQQRRRFYAGYIGFIDENSCKLYVNIRCAQQFKDTLCLYLGGGYTVDSIPELEWIETENKSKTILQCLRDDYSK